MNWDNPFNLISIREKETLCLHADKSVLLFIIEGEIKVEGLDQITEILHQDTTILVPISTKALIKSTKGAKIIIVPFNIEDHFTTDYIQSLLTHTQTNNTLLPVNKPINHILSSIRIYLEDGINTAKLFETIRTELFLLIQLYYEKEKVASLFAPILNKDIFFKSIIIQNCLSTYSLDELARLTKYSKSGFIQKFHRCFGQSPYRWILQYKVKRIMQELLSPSKNFKEIADNYNFASYSYFYTFCKKHYGVSPNEVRKSGSKQ